MKVLYFYPEYSTPMFSWQRIHIFDELEKHGVSIEAFNPLSFSSVEEANAIFIKKLQSNKYDLLLSSVCYEGMIFPEVLSAAHSIGLPSLCIRWDNLTVPYYDEKQAKDFDLVWLTAHETENLYSKWGARFITQPYAANPFAFKYLQKEINRKVCFIGTPYGSRSLMINQLTSNQVPVVAFYGGGKKSSEMVDVKYDMVTPSQKKILFDRLRYKEGRKIMWGMLANKFFKGQPIKENECLERRSAVQPIELSDYYSEYALSLASTSTNHTDSLKRPLPIINLRNFEIPMSGGVEICKYNSELAGYFEEGKEILFYKSNDELVDKARYYTMKAKDNELIALKHAARKRAEADHTWWKRFSVVFDTIGLRYY